MAVADLNTFQARIRSVVRGFHVYKAVVLEQLQLISTSQKIIKAELGAKFIGEKIWFTSNWRFNYSGAINPSSTVSPNLSQYNYKNVYYMYLPFRPHLLVNITQDLVPGLFQ